MLWGQIKKAKSFKFAWCGLLSKHQSTGLCIHWCLLLNCPSGGKWLLYTVALVALTLGYDIYDTKNYAETEIYLDVQMKFICGFIIFIILY